MRENSRAILVADVGSLAVDLRRVVHLEEILHERAVGDLGRIEADLDDFGMPGGLVADILVGWVLGLAAGITRDGGVDTRDLGVLIFDTPETAGTEGGFFEFRNGGHSLFSGRKGVGGEEQACSGNGDEA